jgi:hypothetical protein
MTLPPFCDQRHGLGGEPIPLAPDDHLQLLSEIGRVRIVNVSLAPVRSLLRRKRSFHS